MVSNRTSLYERFVSAQHRKIIYALDMNPALIGAVVAEPDSGMSCAEIGVQGRRNVRVEIRRGWYKFRDVTYAAIAGYNSGDEHFVAAELGRRTGMTVRILGEIVGEFVS